MRALLDSHPNLIVYPVEVTNYLRLFMKVSLGKSEAKMSDINKLLLEYFGRDSFGHFYQPGSGPAYDFRNIQRDIFDSEIRTLSDVICSPSSYIENIQKAYLSSLSHSDALSAEQKIAFVLQTNDANIEAYLRYFRDSQVIFMIRNPLNCLNSKKKFYSNRLNLKLGKRRRISIVSIEQIRDSFKSAEEFFFEPRVKIVRLEDLQNNPSDTMRHIASFMGVEFNDKLLIPTVLGKEYPGSMLEKVEGNKIQQNLSSSLDCSFVTCYENLVIQKYVPSTKFYFFQKAAFNTNNGVSFGLNFLRFFPEERTFWKQLFRQIYRKGNRSFMIRFFAFLFMGLASSFDYYIGYRRWLYVTISNRAGHTNTKQQSKGSYS